MRTIEDIYKHIHFTTYENKAFASILYLGQMGEKFFENKLAPFGISAPQFRILRALRRAPNGIAIYNLIEFLPDRKSDTSRIAVRMEKMGVVRRTKDTIDKRVVNVKITEKGMKLLAEIDAHESELAFEIKDLDEEKAKQLYELLQPFVDFFSN
jgi:DNA-binding MarR family transcriptional regulator